MPRLVRIALTFTIVSCLWVLFLFDFNEAALFISSAETNGLQLDQVATEMWVFLALAAFICFRVDFEPLAKNALSGMWALRNVAFGVLFLAALVFVDRSDTFIYFRF